MGADPLERVRHADAREKIVLIPVHRAHVAAHDGDGAPAGQDPVQEEGGDPVSPPGDHQGALAELLEGFADDGLGFHDGNES